MSVLIVLLVGKSLPMIMRQKLALGMKKVIFVFRYRQECKAYSKKCTNPIILPM